MPACWCRARRSRYAPRRATGSLAPDRRRDRCCRTTKSQRLAGSEQWRAPGRVSQDPASCVRCPCRLSVLLAKPAYQIGKLRWYALAYIGIVHGPKKFADPCLGFAAQADFLVWTFGCGLLQLWLVHFRFDCI